MKDISRILFLACVAFAVLCPGVSSAKTSHPATGASPANDYPSKPVRWIVAVASGGSNDVIARLVAQKLFMSLGQQFIVDNRAGAGGSIGAEIVAKAIPDGYTLLLANPGPNINNVLLRKNPGYSMSDFKPVIFMGYTPIILAANPGFPPRDAKEIVLYAKANPGKVTWGTSGNGSPLYMGMVLFQAATGIDVVHVPYKGAVPALADLVGGQINLMYVSELAGEAYISSGRIKILAIAGPKRLDRLPKVPTLAEQGIANADAQIWFGIVAPAKTSSSVINILNREVNNALELRDVRQQLDSMGVMVAGGTPAQFAAFMSSEADRLTHLIKIGRVVPMN